MIYAAIGRIVVWLGVAVGAGIGMTFLWIWVQLLLWRCSGGC
ncbi:MAG: hypothetical protein QHD01_31975 [Bradyrhizobium sp.]|nr:hypothetical protein [Bradyrhizobium sp.]MDX3971189.1 hypothetical protein [Bradyrhizobium sp.]